jgi:peptidylprolyl isomerase
MKLTCTLFLLASSAFAQTAAKPATTATTTSAKPHTAYTHPCDKLPQISPKVPALPPGSPCPRPLYTMSTVPNINLDYVSPMMNPDIRTSLGIEATRFSLDYVDVKVGTGELATPHKWYTVEYSGYLLDGTEFDSSYDRTPATPFTFPYGQHHVIAGWDTGLDGMRVGGKRRLFIPWELAYGPNGKPPTIPAKSELIFDIELLAITDHDPSVGVPGTPAAGAQKPPSAPSVPATPPTPPPAPSSTPAPASPPAPAPAPAAPKP